MIEAFYLFDGEIFLRLFFSFLAGGIIGLERQYHDKPAGFSTNTLICMGATIFTIVSVTVGTKYNFDPGRIAAQIITGVGFLGAGAILRDGLKISGLTTAAAVWLVAAIGMAIGYGMYSLAGMAMVLVLTLQLILRKTISLFERVRRYDVLRIVCDPSWKVVDKISDIIKTDGVEILGRTVNKEKELFVISLTATFNSHDFERITKDLFEMKEVKEISH